jgi:sugar phosphate isomerase/epimerase
MLALFIAANLVAPQKADFKLSVQAWTFNRFTAFEAVEKASMAGSQYIEFYPGQTMKPGSDVKVGPEMGDTATKELVDQCIKFHIAPVAFGVTGIPNDPAKARPLFQWAKGIGIQVINTESVDAIDTIEAMVKEFDMRVGFHDHPKRANDPNYRMWDPNYVLSIVKNRDRRIGSCADTGHWVRSGIKPVDAIRILKGRIMSSHVKDLSEFSPNGHDVPWGMGVSDVPGIFAEYRKQGFMGPASVEYEFHEDNNLVEVANCLGFARGILNK